MPAHLRPTLHAALVTLALGWGYALVYALRRESVHAALPGRELFGARQFDADDAQVVARALDWSIAAWVVLPVALVVCVLVVAVVGVGHIVLIVAVVACTPVLPMFGAYFSLDPVLALIATVFGISAAGVVVRFLKALGSA